MGMALSLGYGGWGYSYGWYHEPPSKDERRRIYQAALTNLRIERNGHGREPRYLPPKKLIGKKLVNQRSGPRPRDQRDRRVR